MSEIRILINTLDIYNLQTRTASFSNQEKLLKIVDIGYTCVFMNVNAKNPITKRCPGPKYGVIYRPEFYNSQVT